MKQNLKKETIISQRLIKNYMSANSLKPHTITINQQLERSVKASWGRYNQHLEEEKEKEKKKKKSEEFVQLENEISTIAYTV